MRGPALVFREADVVSTQGSFPHMANLTLSDSVDKIVRLEKDPQGHVLPVRVYSRSDTSPKTRTSPTGNGGSHPDSPMNQTGPRMPTS